MPDFVSTDIAAIVPLRSGSKGLRGKNTRLLAGKPLYEYATDQAVRVAGNCIVTTDIPQLLCKEWGQYYNCFERPSHLAQDTAPMADVLLDLFATLSDWEQLPDVAILLQATSPLRADSDVDAAIRLFRSESYDLVMSVVPADKTLWKHGTIENGTFKSIADPHYCFTNRQELPEIYKPNGAVYVFSPEKFLTNGGFPASNIGVVEMSAEASLDIDCEEDLIQAEAILLEDRMDHPVRGAA